MGAGLQVSGLQELVYRFPDYESGVQERKSVTDAGTEGCTDGWIDGRMIFNKGSLHSTGKGPYECNN